MGKHGDVGISVGSKPSVTPTPGLNFVLRYTSRGSDSCVYWML